MQILMIVWKIKSIGKTKKKQIFVVAFTYAAKYQIEKPRCGDLISYYELMTIKTLNSQTTLTTLMTQCTFDDSNDFYDSKDTDDSDNFVDSGNSTKRDDFDDSYQLQLILVYIPLISFWYFFNQL